MIPILSFGQVKDTTIVISKKDIKIEYDIKLSKSELKKYLDNFRADYISSSNKASILLKSILNDIPLSQNACVNGGFENESANWTGLSLKHSTALIPIENGLTLSPGILPVSSIVSPAFAGNFISFEIPGSDPVLTASSPSFSLLKVVSGTKSIRLGNNSKGFGSEGIAKRFVVTSQNAQYFFQYATIMDKSHSNPNGSTNGSEVFFIAEAVDNMGNTIDKIVDIGNPSNPFINAVSSSWGSNSPPNNVFYRNWRCASLDLSSKIGQEVVVMFINSDCSAGGHKGYTYIDAVCETCVNTNEGDIDINISPENCLNFPQTIGGTFTLPASGNAVNLVINLQIFQNNVLVTTLTNPVISGGSYSFTVNPGDFPNQDVGQCYDLVANLSFQIPDMNGNLQTVTQTSSSVVNGIQDGERPGVNNDVCFCIDDGTCCDIPGFEVSIRKPRFGSDQLSLILSGITTPVQEIEVSVIDYHVTYGDPACRPASLGIFGNLSSNQSVLNGLNLNGSGTQVLDWTAGTPGVFNGQIPIKISKPSILKLSCCKGTFSFCLKIKIVDVNCNVCEKIVCFDLPLEEQKIISHEPPKEIGDLGDPKPTGPIIIGDLSDLPITNPNDVYNPITGKTWMNKNLGASQVATSPTDAAAYGDLYQWGRLTDGHEKRTSGITTTLSSNDVSGHGDFIIAPNNPNDWRNPQNVNLWQGVSGINNPCPTGYRLPTEAEFEAERASWGSNNPAGAFASPLKLPIAGYRHYISGSANGVGSEGYYWSSTVSSNYSRVLTLFSIPNSAGWSSFGRASGLSVRCIKN